MSGGGSSAPTSQTVTQVQQIPQYEQDFSQANQNLAASLASQPYPNYQGPLVAGFSPQQDQSFAATSQAAGAYQPGLNQATSVTQGALGQGESVLGQAAGQTNQAVSGAQPYYGAAAQGTTNAVNASANNPNTINSYMSPYLQASLQPQIDALNTQLGLQQNQTNALSTQANAFGDARQGAQTALNNYYANQSLAGIVGTGYNTGYNNAVSAAQNQQQIGLSGANQLANIGTQQGQLGLSGANQLANIGSSEGNLGLSGGQQLAGLAGQQQTLGLAGANALNATGTQQQTQLQNEYNTAYSQFQNQTQYPYQQLSVRESAISNSPYTMTNSTILPGANSLATGIGSFASLAGGLGSLLSGSSKAGLTGSTTS